MEVQNLKSYLANIKMTAEEFSEIIDCAPTYLRNIMNGHKIPSKRLAKDIYEATSGVIKLATSPPKEKKKKTNQDNGEEKKAV